MLKTKKPVKKDVKAKATVYKEVQETFIVRQGRYNKDMNGFWLDFPMEAIEQVKSSIKEDAISPVKVVKFGHNRTMYFFPTKLSKTRKTEIKRGTVMRLVTKHFPYSSVSFIRNNGLVEDKKRVEVEGKRAVTVKKEKDTAKNPVKKLSRKH